LEDGQLLRSGCQNAGKAHGLCHNLTFRSKGIDLEKIHAESVTVACDRVLATSRFVSIHKVSRPVRGLAVVCILCNGVCNAEGLVCPFWRFSKSYCAPV